MLRKNSSDADPSSNETTSLLRNNASENNLHAISNDPSANIAGLSHHSSKESVAQDDSSLNESLNRSPSSRWSGLCNSLKRKRNKIILIVVALFLLLLILIALLMVYVIIPKMAENYMKEATFVIFSAKMTNLSNKNFDLIVNATISNPSMFKLVTKGTPSVSLLFQGECFGRTMFPDQLTIDAKVGSVLTNQGFPVEILNTGVLENFLAQTATQETVVWAMSGKLSVSSLAGTLNLQIPFEKEVIIKGMNGLKEAHANNLILSQTQSSVKVKVNSTIHNPSIMTLESKGIINFEIFLPLKNNSQELLLGYSTATDFMLIPGWNQIILQGSLLEVTKDSSIHISEFLTSYISGIQTPLKITCSTTSDFENSPPAWLLKSLSRLPLVVKLNGIENFSLLKAIDILSMSLLFPLEPSPKVELGKSSTVLATYNSPFPELSFKIPSMLPDLSLYFGTRLAAAVEVFQKVPVIHNPDNTSIKAALSGELLSKSEDSKIVFINMMETVIVDPVVHFDLRGIIHVELNVPGFGESVVLAVPIEESFRLPALGNLALIVKDVKVISGSETELKLSITGIMKNPSLFDANLGRTIVGIQYKNKIISQALIDQTKFSTGETELVALASVKHFDNDEESELLAKEFLSKFASGISNPFTMIGNSDSSSHPILQKVMSAFYLESILHGIPRSDAMIKQIYVSVSGFFQILSFMDVYNPFDVPVTITAVGPFNSWKLPESGSDKEELLLGIIDATPLSEKEEISVPPKGNFSPEKGFKMKPKAPIAEIIKILEGGVIYVRVEGFLSVKMGSFLIEKLPYSQTEIPVIYRK